MLSLEGRRCRGFADELVEGFEYLAEVFDRSILFWVEMEDGGGKVISRLEFTEALEGGR